MKTRGVYSSWDEESIKAYWNARNEKEIKELKSKIAETKPRLKNERKERIEMEEKVKYIELKIRRLKNFGVEEIVENVS